MTVYYRPILNVGPGRPDHALTLGGGWSWFTDVEVLSRETSARVIPVSEAPEAALAPLTLPRADCGALTLDRPRVMGILNATPDSFSDGGQFNAAKDAIDAGRRMVAQGVDVLDVGGESTRPGAQTVAAEEEVARVAPVIAGLGEEGVDALISIDTRKAAVAQAALDVGAGLINDVSGFTYDAALAPLAARRGVPVCVMHALGDPETMQRAPQYDDVLLDVYDFLDRQIAALVAQGVPRGRIVADPGIGFGKTLDHNLTLLARISLFHGLGVPLLLGASRKRFIGTLGHAPEARDRAPGSIGVALAALAQGVQILRVHDVAETVQAISLWRASVAGTSYE